VKPDSNQIAEHLNSVDLLNWDPDDKEQCKAAQMMEPVIGPQLKKDIDSIQHLGSLIHYICHILVVAYQLGYEGKASQEVLERWFKESESKDAT